MSLARTHAINMAQSLARVCIHIIFSTKNREPLIHSKVRRDLHAYIAGILRKLGSPSLRTGGVEDHVHILLSLGRTRTIAEVVEETKKATSKWMKRQGIPDFWWQAGYGAFSVAQSQVAAVVRYIERQEEHHRTQTFQDEFRQLLSCHQISYDERYVWD